MAITDKARKLLWGRAGARCSYCKRNLVMNATENDDNSIVGDECHIYARHGGGSRYNPTLSENEIDSYENLVLLCKNHHKMVDDQPGKFTADTLIKLKADHELWVDTELQPKKNTPKINIAIKVDNASDVVRTIHGCELYDFQHDELETAEEVEAIATFLQDLQDYGDIHSDMDAADRTRFTFSIKRQMKELDHLGFAIFIASSIRTFAISGTPMNFSMVSLRVVRKTNPDIQTISPDDLRNVSEELIS